MASRVDCRGYATAAAFDLQNSALSLTLANGVYTVGAPTAAFRAADGHRAHAQRRFVDDGHAAVRHAVPDRIHDTTHGVQQRLRVATNPSSLTPNAAELLSGGPRWCAAWHDPNPGVGGQVRFDSCPTGVVVAVQGFCYSAPLTPLGVVASNAQVLTPGL
jgi:hypothetical protein